MGKITSAIDNIASTQEGIMKKMDWITDAAAEVSATETFSLIVNDYMNQLKETIVELRALESDISNGPIEIGRPGNDTRQ